jgi:hypothetical protein
MYLDVVVGTTKPDAEHDRSHISDLANKVRELNQKLEDIRREQQYQREREADYRNLSEATNSRAVWYSVAQILLLVGTCAWQLRHLKVRIEIRYSAPLLIDLAFASGSSRIEKCADTGLFIITYSSLWLLDFQKHLPSIASLRHPGECAFNNRSSTFVGPLCFNCDDFMFGFLQLQFKEIQ